MKLSYPQHPMTLRCLLFCLFTGFMSVGTAQIPGLSDKSSGNQSEIPPDPLGRNTPRGTVIGFVNAVAENNYDLAGQYLDKSGLKDTATAPEVAKSMQELFKLGSLMPLTRLSEKRTGRTDDGLATDLERVGRFETDGGTREVLVQKVKGKNGDGIWLFSSSTVAFVVEAHADIRAPIDPFMRGFLSDTGLLGVPNGHWLAALLLVVFSYLLARGIIYVAERAIPMVWHRAASEPIAGTIRALAIPVAMYVAIWCFVLFSRYLGLSIVLRQKFSVLTSIVGVAAILLLLWRLARFIGNYTQNKMVSQGNLTGVSVVVFTKRAAKTAIVLIGILAILNAVGVDVTAGLAALGIGGIALALGAQKAVENFVGGVALITDQPVRVGDYCKVGDISGTVESIGMRSTRLRTPNRTLVTIPNGEFSSSKIENFAARDRFWFHPALTLRYETTPDQVRYLLVQIRSLLYAHPKMSPDPARVRFTALGSDKLVLDVYAYALVSDYNEFLEVQEDLLLRIMDLVKESGTEFAFPSQTIYFAKDSKRPEDKVRQTEERVRE